MCGGKFLFAGDVKLYVRGVTYGPFQPDEDGCFYHTPLGTSGRQGQSIQPFSAADCPPEGCKGFLGVVVQFGFPLAYAGSERLVLFYARCRH